VPRARHHDVTSGGNAVDSEGPVGGDGGGEPERQVSPPRRHLVGGGDEEGDVGDGAAGEREAPGNGGRRRGVGRGVLRDLGAGGDRGGDRGVVGAPGVGAERVVRGRKAVDREAAVGGGEGRDADGTADAVVGGRDDEDLPRRGRDGQATREDPDPGT